MPNLKSAKGSLIAFAGVFLVVVAILIPVAMKLVQNIRLNTQESQLFVAGAQNAAKAGLEDTLGYFVRQNKLMTSFSSQIIVPTPTAYAAGMSYVDQPFEPFYNTVNAAYSDTFQSTTQFSGAMTFPFYGLCNEYPIDASTNTLAAAGQTTSVYFARYEVAQQPPTGSYVTMAVHDISGTRVPNYMNGDGLTWGISSTGYIYKRMDYSVDQYGEYLIPYNVYPNKVLATAKAYTEFRKLSCNLPNSGAGDAAVYASAATDVQLTTPCYLGGVMASGYGLCAMEGSAGATMPTGGSSSDFFGASTILSPGSSSPSANAPISDVSVFGMSLRDIQFIADYVGSSSIPLTIQEPYKLSYYNGNLTYGPGQSSTIYQELNSTGILIVNGNLTLQSGGFNAGNVNVFSSYYSGIVFSTGNVTIQPGCQLDGVVILGYSAASTNNSPPQLVLQGASGNYAYMTADPSAVKNVIKQVAQYREDISARKVLLAFPGI